MIQYPFKDQFVDSNHEHHPFVPSTAQIYQKIQTP